MTKVSLALPALLAACCLTACGEREIVSPTATVSQLAIGGNDTLLEGQSAGYWVEIAWSDGTATIEFATGVQWSSGTRTVADFNTGGATLAALRAGTTLITAVFSGRTATKTVTVVAPPPPPTATPPATPTPPLAPADGNGSWTIASSPLINPCSGFSFDFSGQMEVSAIDNLQAQGIATLRRSGNQSPISVSVRVMNVTATGFTMLFTAQLSFGGNLYNYTMTWQVTRNANGSLSYTGTQELSGPCTNRSNVSGGKS